LQYALQSTEIVRIKCRSRLSENILICFDSLHPLGCHDSGTSWLKFDMLFDLVYIVDLALFV